MQKRTFTTADLLAARKLRRLWEQEKDRLGLTQEKAAELLGFSTQGTVSHYLNGRLALGAEAVLRFATLLQVSPEEIRPDMAQLFATIRQTPTHKTEHIATPRSRDDLTEKELLLLELYNDLPDSEAEKILNLMKDKRDYFERIMKELAEKKANKNHT